jgi:hypothetical protein
MFEASMPPSKDVWFVFEMMHHTIVLHQHQVLCVYDILGNKELGDWVKVRSNT